MTRFIRTNILILATALMLAGCAPFIRIEQPANSDLIRLDNGENIGQTFTASYRGLNGAAIYIKPDAPGDGQLILHMQEAQAFGTGADLARATLSLEQVSGPGFYRLNFPPQTNSSHHDYYLWFEIQGSGSLLAASGPGDTYLDGALYLNHEPQDAQLTFRLAYDRLQALQGLLLEGGQWLAWVAIALILFMLPGWAILSYCFPDWEAQWWVVKAGLSVGVSFAIYPLLFLWTDLIGLHLGAFYAWLPALLGAGGLIWRYRQRPPKSSALKTAGVGLFPNLAMIVVLALLILTRFWIARGLLVPLWGDSYQHTMITQLLIDHGGLFTNWLPYSPSLSFSYHFGFHSLSAVFHWMSGLPASQSTIWTGQLANVFAVLSLAPLAVWVGRSRWAGVAAVFIGGLLLTLPQVYINWGRYTQLAGQVILPVAAILGWLLLSEDRFQKRQIAVLGIVMSGLALTHYRILVFGGAFLVAAWLIGFKRRTALHLAWRILQAGLVAIVLFLPWFLRIFSGKIMALFAAQVSTPASQVGAAIQEFNTIGNLFNFMPAWLWLLLFLVIALGLWRRESGVAVIALWWMFNLLAANPQWLNLPGAGAIGSFTVLIAIYIPVSILMGGSVGWLIEAIQSRVSSNTQEPPRHFLSVLPSLLLMATIGASLWCARLRLNDLNLSGSTLFTRADQRGAVWIQSNLPQEAVFLVNSFLAYGGTVAVGSDGGWWLPLQANRQTTLPPINYDTEAGPRPDYTAWVNDLITTVQENGLNDPDTLGLLQAHHVTHIYVGQRQGSVNSPGALFSPDELVADPHFEALYHQDRVWIFSVPEP